MFVRYSLYESHLLECPLAKEKPSLTKPKEAKSSEISGARVVKGRPHPNKLQIVDISTSLLFDVVP